jgi:hypothetical protein
MSHGGQRDCVDDRNVVSEGLWRAKIVLLLFFVSYFSILVCIVPSCFGTPCSAFRASLLPFLLEAVGNRNISFFSNSNIDLFSHSRYRHLLQHPNVQRHNLTSRSLYR